MMSCGIYRCAGCMRATEFVSYDPPRIGQRSPEMECVSCGYIYAAGYLSSEDVVEAIRRLQDEKVRFASVEQLAAMGKIGRMPK